jgi:hypothetical protein
MWQGQRSFRPSGWEQVNGKIIYFGWEISQLHGQTTTKSFNSIGSDMVVTA